MICPKRTCGAAIAASAKFCPECGIGLGVVGPTQEVNTGGGNLSGVIYQAGGDLHIDGAHSQPVARYRTKWSWCSPLTLAVLTWISVGLGVLGVIAGWQGFVPPFEALAAMVRGGGFPSESPEYFWVFACFAVMLLFVVALWLRNVAKHRTQHFSPLPWLPVITGWGGRIGLARLQGVCPIDGGRLKFYDKPVEMLQDRRTGRRKVIKRQMAAQCVRDSGHWWPVDKTEGSPVG